MSEDAPLIPIEEHQVRFYDDTIIAVLVKINDMLRVCAPLRPIIMNLGIDWSSQYRRAKQDPVLSKYLVSVVVTTTESQRGSREMICLPIEYLHGWLFGINAQRLKSDMQDKVIRYQEDCYRALWEMFGARTLHDIDTALAPSGTQDLQQIAEMGRAITAMAEQQMEMQQRQDTVERRLNVAGQVVKNIQDRLESVEDKLHPHAYITDEQAAEVSTVVKALAEMLTRQEKGKNHYQGIFGELHRRFGVPSYKHIRQEQYADVLAFLDDWRDAAMEGRERQDEAGDA
jgi:hypothetical protein